MRVTDEVSEQLAELHLTLGEGPCLDAAASGGPVLASDLAGGESGRRWPVFALAARQAGAAAIFAFPLRIGAIRAGVLGLYRAVVLTLFLLRHDNAQHIAGELFGCSQSTVSRIFRRIRPLLDWCSPGLTESSWLVHATDRVAGWSFSYSIGVSIPRALWRRWRLWKISK